MISLLDDNDSDIQKLNEIERKRKELLEKKSKKEIRAKLSLSDFFLKTLEQNAVAGLNEYVINNYEKSLNSEDKKALSSLVDKVKSIAQAGIDNNKKEGNNTSKSAENSPAQPQQIKPTVSQNSPQPA